MCKSLLIDKYKDQIKTIEEGKERILEIKRDYEKVVEAVTERKFYLEGKTLSELRGLHSQQSENRETKGYGTWIKTYTELGYSRTQVDTLIMKFEMSKSYASSEAQDNNLEKLNYHETVQLKKLTKENKELAVAILETENAKLELKKLREELKKQKELELENAEKVEVLEYEK